MYIFHCHLKPIESSGFWNIVKFFCEIAHKVVAYNAICHCKECQYVRHEPALSLGQFFCPMAYISTKIHLLNGPKRRNGLLVHGPQMWVAWSEHILIHLYNKPAKKCHVICLFKHIHTVAGKKIYIVALIV
ncbi:hypothetical protein [Infectious spleen and kidney necrosis virus]|nr:hypothetical protein [Infectious spleen and kidney necrosis virus]WNH14587.1 hypothetical protein [Infectious spleen and kidney necrosis virus]